MFLSKISKLFFNKFFVHKLLAYILLIVSIIILQDFLLIFFLIFVFSYLFLTLWKFLKSKLDSFFSKKWFWIKNSKILKKFFSLNIIIVFLYLVFVWLLVFVIIDLLPQLIQELEKLPKYIPALSEQINIINTKLQEIKNINTEIWWSLNQILSKQDMDILLQILEKLKAFWYIFLQIFLSLILSYIFIIDRDKLHSYLIWLKESNFNFLYFEYKNIVKKVVKTFWLVFKAQGVIAFINTVLTTIWLFIIWTVHWETFPFLMTLAIIVFLCWFIPVLGTFISSVPILLIWYVTFWWWWIIFEIIFLVALVHAIEAYWLNPKIVSSFIHLPVSLTFMILIISEHFMWPLWLLIWIASFYFIMELLKDADIIISKSKFMLTDIEQLEKETKENIKKNIRLSRKDIL